MMSSAQLRSLAAMGMEIGAHTVSHPILTRLSAAEATKEILGSRIALEKLLGIPVQAFAYPNGHPEEDYSAAHVAMVREAGFDYAVSTGRGPFTASSDRHQIPRIAPWDRSLWRYATRVIATYGGGAAATV
jgi:peptidoglycan/xylan/chitin deacetylase (PgdA/CDA1 family)